MNYHDTKKITIMTKGQNLRPLEEGEKVIVVVIVFNEVYKFIEMYSPGLLLRIPPSVAKVRTQRRNSVYGSDADLSSSYPVKSRKELDAITKEFRVFMVRF